MDTGLAIFLGAVIGSSLATMGWIFGQRQNRRLTRLEHTFSVLNSYRDDKDHWEAHRRFVSMAKSQNIPTPDDPARQDDIAVLSKLFTHYEYIAAGIFCGGLDENLIKACDRGNIVYYFCLTSYVY